MSVLTREELLHEVLVEPQQAYFPAPDTSLIERPGWVQLITPSLKDGGVNEVIRSQVPEAEIEQVIDRTIAEYAQHGIRFRWRVTPETQPADTGARLLRRGFIESILRGMARSTEPLGIDPDPS